MTSDRPTSRWLATQMPTNAARPVRQSAIITAADVRPIAVDLDVWDLWPIQDPHGAVACFDSGQLWMALGAQNVGEPIARHAVARLRLLRRTPDAWRDLGPVFPDHFTPGSREWSGSAVIDADRVVTLFFTAAGRRGEAKLTFEQRIFQTRAPLLGDGAAIRFGAWTAPREAIRSDGVLYDRADQTEGAAGSIKAFRDPSIFRDPGDNRDYLLFTGSLGAPSSAFNGAVGIARASPDATTGWDLLPPILHADGLNNELERPHALYRDGLYYLFWSTQHEVFAPDGPRGPTGLYGMAAPTLLGPYLPLNGDGLVLSNPPEAPYQAYSWWVMSDLSVVSFINYWGYAGATAPEGEAARRCFGGVPAPVQQIRLEGSKAWEVFAVNA